MNLILFHLFIYFVSYFYWAPGGLRLFRDCSEGTGGNFSGGVGGGGGIFRELISLDGLVGEIGINFPAFFDYLKL